MPNVNDDDAESLNFADESDYLDDDNGDVDDDLAAAIDPPSPAAELLHALIADASYEHDETAGLVYGDIGDTNPAGVGEAAVRVRDPQLNAEFLVVAVPWLTATEIDDLSGMWLQLVELAQNREPQR